MLNDLFQKSHDHHRSLPLLGPILDDFDDWLFEQGYRYSTRQCYMLRCTAIEKYFRRRKQCSLSVLTPEKLRECWRFYCRRPGGIAGTVRCLQRFLQSRQMLPAPIGPPASALGAIVDAYRQYMSEVRGLAPITIEQHGSTVAELLQHCLGQDGAFQLIGLTRTYIESFMISVANRFGRSSMQHVVGHIRGFLRFLVMQGQAPTGLDSQIDTPRVYRLEQLPRALPWETVCAFLESIDRTCASGRRDYAIFLLIAAYGLRGCDIAGLKLTDIDWHAGELRLNQSKTRQPLRLPLTDPVAQALLAYLREGRPRSAFRELFLTAAAPILPLKRQAAGYAFRSRVKRSGLDIAFRGVHCLRHSYAVHLLRQGVSLKGIGDLLGHRSTESTCVYLRLDLDELREVALPLPALATQESPS
jgi:site-specific recombinase XerD